MSAARDCERHGPWVDDGTTDDCPECVAERIVAARAGVLGLCVHGYDLDRQFCPRGCRV